MKPEIRESVADYLRGYVAGYWAGYDFAVDEPGLAHEEEGDVEVLTAAGDADAPSTAPAPDPSSRRFAPGPPSKGAPKGPEGSRASAVESLPAIRQPALRGEDEVVLAGELEKIHAHRGIVLGLRIAAAEMFRIDLPEAEQAILRLIDDWGIPEVQS